MTTRSRVVAGYDGSIESQHAVRWAAAAANRRGLPLRVLNATGVDPTSPAAYRAGVAVGSQQRAQSVAEEGAEIARETARIDVEAIGVEQGSVAALVGESDDAELVVIGSRGLGRLRGALLGSSAFSVAMHAECPVAVVRGALRPLPSSKFPIVVGVDGSESSGAAVKEAARLASETGARLKIVVAYDGPSHSPWLVAQYPQEIKTGAQVNVGQRQAFDPDLDGTSSEGRQKQAARFAQNAADVVAELYSDVAIELIVAAGRPERAIAEAADDASLIVVGARGRGDFASLLLGSVSRDVIQNADCAVYVVR